jgi:hypothetical protein
LHLKFKVISRVSMWKTSLQHTLVTKCMNMWVENNNGKKPLVNPKNVWWKNLETLPWVEDKKEKPNSTTLPNFKNVWWKNLETHRFNIRMKIKVL